MSAVAEPYKAGEMVQVHIKHDIQRGTVSVMVSCPWTMAPLNQKQNSRCSACLYAYV